MLEGLPSEGAPELTGLEAEAEPDAAATSLLFFDDLGESEALIPQCRYCRLPSQFAQATGVSRETVGREEACRSPRSGLFFLRHPAL